MINYDNQSSISRCRRAARRHAARQQRGADARAPPRRAAARVAARRAAAAVSMAGADRAHRADGAPVLTSDVFAGCSVTARPRPNSAGTAQHGTPQTSPRDSTAGSL